jgi:LSD1 subclass zinc finger protein
VSRAEEQQELTTGQIDRSDMATQEDTSVTAQQHKCDSCGAQLTYAPGTTVLKCEYCGAENRISQPSGPVQVEEIDYERFLSETNLGAEQTQQLHTVACNGCGASSTLRPNVTSDTCPFCGSALVLTAVATTTIVKPRYLLPFKIDYRQALAAFRTWISKLWFAPNDLKRYASQTEKLCGLYIPYWTYDADTDSSYTGQRGTNHTQHYTTRENGCTVTRTRTVVHWSPVSGRVANAFDDVLVMASASLPRKYADKLEPWDLGNLTEYNEQYLSGFRTEAYQLSLRAGFENARLIMDDRIRQEIRRDIGGDHQRIDSVHTTYGAITFKHILLPIWISAYRFQGKVYRFLINGRTGEVQGERPWSWVKITLTALTAAAVIAAVYFSLAPLAH